MSSVVISGDTSGQVTLAAPAVAGTTTLTLPATTGTVLNDATVGVCRAWVNFNGTLTTPITPRAAFNVSSVTKNTTCDYTVNFTNALSDANYATIAMNNVQTYSSIKTGTTPTTTAVNVVTGGASDSSYMNLAIFR